MVFFLTIWVSEMRNVHGIIACGWTAVEGGYDDWAPYPWGWYGNLPFFAVTRRFLWKTK